MPRTRNGNYFYTLDPLAADPRGSAEYQERWDKACETQEAEAAVAPGCTVGADTGDKHEGDELTAADIKDPSALNELVRERAAIRLSKEELHRRQRWADATHWVGEKALIASKDSGLGILPPKTPCGAWAFAHNAVPEHQYVDSYGRVMTAPAKKADDGTETLRNLIAKGYVIERPKRLGKKAAK